MSPDQKDFWESIHEENSSRDVSWFQETPTKSLQWIAKLGTPATARILDVGCGQRGIAGALLERGFTGVTALDISAEGLRRAREPLGERGARIEWVEADVLEYTAPKPYDLWHDRAVLHFFTNEEDRQRYAQSVSRNVARGGHAVIATFDLDGPEKCSGLSVQRQDAREIGHLLGPEFRPVGESHEIHTTPWGKAQAFQWAAFRRD